MQYKAEEKTVYIYLEETLDISTIEQQWAILERILGMDRAIVFESKHLKQIDLPALQSLLSFVLTASTRTLTWEWREPPDLLIQMTELLGMRTLLNLPATRGM